jgi:hypothetical protein
MKKVRLSIRRVEYTYFSCGLNVIIIKSTIEVIKGNYEQKKFKAGC